MSTDIGELRPSPLLVRSKPTLRENISPLEPFHKKDQIWINFAYLGPEDTLMWMRASDRSDPKAPRYTQLDPNAYRVWDLDEKRLVVTRTIQLDECSPSSYLNLTDVNQPATVIDFDVDDTSIIMTAPSPQPTQSDIDMEVDPSGIVDEDIVMSDTTLVLTLRTHDLHATPIRESGCNCSCDLGC
ncbi:hypothetical protein PsorP6_004601 [Peronosclerospora sorghi]|uniref:Uncharacterized protein n=1 Tax=Peronosclerospora sorghi TaxID=230839 RepID=A0ACC0VKX7_9STRA|nr:hypothetical protein PsorP6_004601 [Peronosclerospora sorghi]